jgi:hypothetical protein
MGNYATGRPLAAFDYDTALKMVQTPQESPTNTQVDHAVAVPQTSAQEVALEKESAAEVPRKHILRPLRKYVQHVVTAGVMGAAAMAPQEASAGGMNGLEQTAAVIAAGFINNKVFNNTPIGVRVDQNGNGVLVAKSPQEMAMNLVPRFEPGVLEYAQSIGVNVVDNGMMFQLQNAENPQEEINIVRYHDQTRYATEISLKKAQGGGLLISYKYVLNNLPKTQLITVRTFANGKMGAVVVGN